ncbi:MAG: D-alanyl-D-alanine carboxypeptidase family protein [Oscillospiraceae bacterium]|nr:D-alanyl-D-alanine carboxypeptidase family protein [Oscillospiraceae bacterium]
MNKRTAAALGALFIAALLLSGCGETAGWQKEEDKTYYIGTEGSALTGWQEIDGNTYRFSDSGAMLTGWQNIGSYQYYFDEDGAMATGWQTIGGQRCYFRENGSRVTGWLSLDGQRYYLPGNGSAGGVKEIDGTFYLFDENGLLSGGLVQAGGKTYFGNENGHPLTGWQEIDGVRYFFAEDYAAHTGWLTENGFRYYFTEDGSPAAGYVNVDGEKHTFAFNGQEIILVNPWNALPEDYTVELTDISSKHEIASIAVADYKDMMKACRAAGMDPVVCSSYRTWEYQEELHQDRIRRFLKKGYSEEDAAVKAATIVAVPGTSEHQLGLALDIIDNDNWALDESQAKMPAQKWLMEHSWKYGWILRYPDDKSEVTGIIYEPWHYRYVGREVASHIHATGLCLEEYLDMLTK